MSVLGQGVFLGVAGGDQPTLNAPTISRSGDTISISNSSTNGGFVEKYKVYNGDTLLHEQTSTSFSLIGLGAGTYALSVTACGTDFIDSEKSNVINASVYTITRELTNLTANDNSSLISNGELYTVTLTPETGYSLPQDISVYIDNTALSDYLYYSSTGVVSIANVSGNIRIIAAASAIPVADPIYGVSGLANDLSVTLTRTDDAVGMSYAIDSSTGSITSDFNNAFPWNEAEVVNDTAGKFLHMPDMYFRVGVNANNEITDIAVSKTQGDFGTWYKVDSFYYGCYGSSTANGKSQSVSGVARQVNETRAQFRSKSAQNGADYFQLDLYHRTVMIFLWLIEFATRNSDSVMSGRISGSGSQGGSSVRITGGTDNLTTPSGYETKYGQMRYHYIEDFVGNLFEFVDGVNCMAAGANHYVTDDPSEFSDSETGMTALSYAVPSDGNILALGWDSNNPFMCMPIRASGTSYTTGFCDRWVSSGSGYPVLFCGAFWNSSGANLGLAFFHAHAVSHTYSNIGGRLLKKAS